MSISDRIRHFFHVVSNVRPIVWICLYVCCIPLFALFYSFVPHGEFRIPDGGGVDYGSWLYYSIVTITTLGFGDYTPAMGWAQALTAIEVTCGLLIMGFFLNSVGAMKSEIDVASELEKQRLVHEAGEKEKLLKNIPIMIHKLNRFLSYCYVVTTPVADRKSGKLDFDEDFTFPEMCDLYKPTGLPTDHTVRPAVEGLLRCASDTSLFLDSLQSRIDMTIWPDLLEQCFSFVAHTQLFEATDSIVGRPQRIADTHDHVTAAMAEKMISQEIKDWTDPVETKPGNSMNPIIELYYYIKENGDLARKMEVEVTKISSEIS